MPQGSNYTDPRYKKLMKQPRLGKDDSFTFGCNECGRCCRNREDIILSPLDLFKIAKHRETTIANIIYNFCEIYEGSGSRLPIVRVKPREYRKTCPFNEQGKCSIHVAKPAVCAIYPLGRATDGETKEFFYFLNRGSCGNNNRTQTVHEWLQAFSILEEEPAAILWHEYLYEFSVLLFYAEKLSQPAWDELFQYIINQLYVAYDSNKAFSEQFKVNCEKVLALLRKMPGGMHDDKN